MPHLLTEKNRILPLCVSICRNILEIHSSLCILPLDVTIMVQEQLTVFTFLNSKDRTFACASGSDIMAGLTVAREEL